MKSFLEHLSEAAYAQDHPVPGDHFDIEISTDLLIETVVTAINEDGDICIDLDDEALALLENAMGASIQSATPEKDGPTGGAMSPIFGNAFLQYNRKEDPRKWFRKDKSKKSDEQEHEQKEGNRVTMAGAPVAGMVSEAEYQGRKVPLGKPMKGDVKKSKVYVRNANGKVVKVNFGDKSMSIKKSNPQRRKSFRARHHCENPGPRTKARYWSCRAW